MKEIIDRRNLLKSVGITVGGATLLSAASSASAQTGSDISFVSDYAQLRSLGSVPLVSGHIIKVTDDGIHGDFVVKTGSANDNDGTIIVFNDYATSGKYAERIDSDRINVKWFGAKGKVVNGSIVDDGPAIQKAINAAEGGVGGTGRTIYFPNGRYYCGDLSIAYTGQRLEGESKYGTWLVALIGAESIIDVGGIDHAYPVWNPQRNINRRHTTIENLTLDCTQINDTANNAAIRYQSTYGNSLKNVEIVCDGEVGRTSYALYFGEGCYTTLVENVTAKRVRIYSPTADLPTTLTFVNLDSGFVDINSAGAISFIQPIIQSRVNNDFGPYRISCVNCTTLSVVGGYFEDDNTANSIYYLDNIIEHVVSMGNTVLGFQGGYAKYGPTGVLGKTFLQDDKDHSFEYLEGEWTPELEWSQPGNSSIVPGNHGGRFIKNGNLVTCTFYFDEATFNNQDASGYLMIKGLPYTSIASETDSWGGSVTLNIGFPTDTHSILVLMSKKTAVLKRSDGLGSSINVTDVSGNGKYLRGTFCYQCIN